MEKGKENVIIAIDVGTSSLKGGIIDPAGRLVNWVRVPFKGESGKPLETVPAEIWLQAMQSAIGQLPESKRASAIAISGNGPTIVPTDATGKALDEASLWLNKRNHRIEDQPSFFLPKIAWFAEHKPEIYTSARWFLGCPEYLSFFLTGEASAFDPSPEFSPYIWIKEGIEAYQLDGRKIPGLIRTGQVLGTVRREAADHTGLPQNIPVIATAADYLMSLIGTGVLVPGRTCDRAGISEGINCCADRKILHERIRCLPHVIEGRYTNNGILASTGRIFEWFRKFSGQQKRNYHEMLADIAEVKWDHDLPHFYPSLHRGAVWEFSRGVFADLEAHHGSAEMGRAVVSSIGFAIRDVIDTLESQGCEIGTLKISGGQGRNSIWNQMKSDITGKVIEVPHIIDAELAGNAILAFVALGYYPSLIEAADQMVRVDETYEPDMKKHRAYSEEYRDYTRHCQRIIAALS